MISRLRRSLAKVDGNDLAALCLLGWAVFHALVAVHVCHTIWRAMHA